MPGINRTFWLQCTKNDARTASYASGGNATLPTPPPCHLCHWTLPTNNSPVDMEYPSDGAPENCRKTDTPGLVKKGVSFIKHGSSRKQTAYWVDMHTTQKKLPHPSYRSGSLVETQGLSPILAEPLTGEFLRLAKRTPSPQESTSAPTLGFRQQREAICSKRSCSTLVLRRARLSNWTTSLALRPCYAFGVFILRAHLHTWFEAMWCTHILWGVFADIPVFEHVHFLLSVYKVLIRRFPSWQ